MPSNGPTLFFNILPLMSGGPDPTKSNSSHQRFETRLFCDAWPLVKGISHEPLPCVIEHYVTPEGGLPIENAMVFCSGTFKVLTIDGKTTLVVKTLTLQNFPGNPDDDGYEDSCPAPTHAQVNVVGIVGRSATAAAQTEVGFRAYEINMHVWDAEQKSLPLGLWVLVPATRRWEKTPLPKQNALVSVTGEVIGLHEETGHVAIFQQTFSYVNARGTESSTQASQQQSQSSSPVTPKRGRWTAYQTASVTPTKRRPVTPAAPGPSSQPSTIGASSRDDADFVDLGAQTVDSSETEHASET